MSDYLKAFDGAALDSAASPVDPLLFDTEFNKISAALDTKANVIAGGTTGNLAALNSTGDPVTTTIDAADLTPVTSAVQAQLALHEDERTPPTDLVAVGPHMCNDGTKQEAALLLQYAQSSYDNVWRSIGGVGSGADHETSVWDDYVDPDAVAVILLCSVYMTDTNILTPLEVEISAAEGDVTPDADGAWAGIQGDMRGYDSLGWYRSFYLWCPVGADNTIQVKVDFTNGVGSYVSFRPFGSIK